MKHKGYSILLTLAVAMLATVAARGDIPVQLSYVSFGPGVADEIDTASGTPATSPADVDAGAYNHLVIDTSGLIVTSAPGVPTPMFCLDIMQSPLAISNIDSPVFTTYHLVDPADAPQPDYLGHASYPMDETRASWLTLLAQEYWNDAYLGTDNSRHAALQLAIWEIVFEGTDANVPMTGSNDASESFWQASAGPDYLAYFAGGATPSTEASDALDEADTMLRDLWTLVGTDQVQRSEETFLGALVNNSFQDMLVLTERRVPEPTGLALAAMGLLGLVTRRKRRS